MAKFNVPNKGTNTVTNHEGEKAYKMGDKLELYSAVTTFLFEDKFYEKGGARLTRIRELVGKVPADFVAKLAVYAREQMHLRSVPLALAVELAKVHNGDDLVRRTVRRVIQRPDELAEILAYYQTANSRTGQKKLNKLSKQLQLGVGDAFEKFDEYQFSKYDRDMEIKLRDALFIAHPTSTKTRATLYKKIIDRSLATANTWETKLTAAGQKAESVEEKEELKKEAWADMVKSGKIGYMALLRNLRNILESNPDVETVKAAAAILSDPDKVRKSKQFPYRFLSAYRELPTSFDTGRIQKAIEQAIRATADNLPFQENERVVIAVDHSGSMDSKISSMSKISNFEIGLVLALVLRHKIDRLMFGMFGETFKWIPVPGDSIMSEIERVSKIDVGHSTNGWLVIADLIRNKTVTDKVYLFTDCQLWNSTVYGMTLQGMKSTNFNALWQEYKRVVNPDAQLFIIDLAGYGNTPVAVMEKGVFYVAGFSDKIFEVLETFQNGEGALAAIEEIKL